MTLQKPSLGLVHGPTKQVLPAWALKLIIPVAIVVVWELVVRLGVVNESVLAPPSALPATVAELIANGKLVEGIAVSFTRAVVGLVIGTIFGITLAVVAGLWRNGEHVLDPTVQLLRPLPATAIMPLVVLLMGMDEAPKIFLISYAAFFPVYLNTFQGIRAVDNKLIESAAVFGLTRFELIKQVILPSALPSFFVGFRFSVSISWVVLVVAEQLNAQSGVGYLMMDAQRYYRPDIILIGLIVYAIFGLLSDSLVRGVECKALNWRNSFEGA